MVQQRASPGQGQLPRTSGGPALSDLSVFQGESEIWEKIFILKCWKLIKILFNYCVSNKIYLWTVI